MGSHDNTYKGLHDNTKKQHSTTQRAATHVLVLQH